MAFKKAVVKRAKAKKPAAKRKSKVGDMLQCSVCGMAVTIDEDCGCAEVHDIICCGTPMEKKGSRR